MWQQQLSLKTKAHYCHYLLSPHNIHPPHKHLKQQPHPLCTNFITTPPLQCTPLLTLLTSNLVKFKHLCIKTASFHQATAMRNCIIQTEMRILLKGLIVNQFKYICTQFHINLITHNFPQTAKAQIWKTIGKRRKYLTPVQIYKYIISHQLNHTHNVFCTECQGSDLGNNQ